MLALLGGIELVFLAKVHQLVSPCVQKEDHISRLYIEFSADIAMKKLNQGAWGRFSATCSALLAW